MRWAIVFMLAMLRDAIQVAPQVTPPKSLSYSGHRRRDEPRAVTGHVRAD